MQAAGGGPPAAKPPPLAAPPVLAVASDLNPASAWLPDAAGFVTPQVICSALNITPVQCKVWRGAAAAIGGGILNVVHGPHFSLPPHG